MLADGRRLTSLFWNGTVRSTPQLIPRQILFSFCDTRRGHDQTQDSYREHWDLSKSTGAVSSRRSSCNHKRGLPRRTDRYCTLGHLKPRNVAPMFVSALTRAFQGRNSEFCSTIETAHFCSFPINATLRRMAVRSHGLQGMEGRMPICVLRLLLAKVNRPYRWIIGLDSFRLTQPTSSHHHRDMCSSPRWQDKNGCVTTSLRIGARHPVQGCRDAAPFASSHPACVATRLR